jgi:hypothetical protein
MPHTAAGQHLGRPGPHCPQPEYGDPRLLKACERVFTYHLYNPGKSFHIVIVIITNVIINIKNIYLYYEKMVDFPA